MNWSDIWILQIEKLLDYTLSQLDIILVRSKQN